MAGPLQEPVQGPQARQTPVKGGSPPLSFNSKGRKPVKSPIEGVFSHIYPNSKGRKPIRVIPQNVYYPIQIQFRHSQEEYEEDEDRLWAVWYEATVLELALELRAPGWITIGR